MIHLITYPDIVDNGNKKLVLIDITEDDLALIIAAARTLSQDVDFYLQNGESASPEWFAKVCAGSDRIFKSAGYDEVITYLRGLDERNIKA